MSGHQEQRHVEEAGRKPDQREPSASGDWLCSEVCSCILFVGAAIGSNNNGTYLVIAHKFVLLRTAAVMNSAWGHLINM